MRPESSTRPGDGTVARGASNRRAGRPPALRWSIGRLALAVAIGTAVAGLTAGWASRAFSGPSRAAASRVVQAGAARLVVPASWRPARADTALGGVDPKQLVVLSTSPGVPISAVVTFGPADERSLIPRALRALVPHALSQPRATSLAGRPAWAYRAADTPGRRLVMDVTVLPTTAGMLAVACAWPVDFTGAAPDCASSVKSVSVHGAATLTPSSSVAFAAALPAQVARLDDARATGRALLSRARTPGAQAAAAHRLARQHRAVADELRTAFGTAARPLIGGLKRSGRAYTALGTAAADGAPARFRAARQQVRVAETELEAGIHRALKAGARQTPASAATSPAAPAIEPARPPVTKLLFIMLALLASAAAGFVASGPVAAAITKPWRPNRRPLPPRARG